ncbi:MAG TPA: ABC transporter ATP-binding protein/permease [Candidatus Binatia bacterium]|jgi:putative ATP-binding cassette transporter
MTPDTGRPIFGRRFRQQLARLVGIYWRSPDAGRGALLLALTVALELATVAASVYVARAEGAIMDAIVAKEATAFVRTVAAFLAVSLTFLVTSTYRIYVRQALEIRWRRAVTASYVERWMSPEAYALGELHRGAVDNPDQRVAEDIRDFVASALGLSMSLLAAVVTLISFGGMLWGFSRSWGVQLGAVHLEIPGLMLWVGLAFAGLSTWMTHVVGRRLVPLNFDRLRLEADFRYGLMRFRDSVEPVALSHGEEVERRGAMQRFRHVIANWWRLIVAQRNLTLLTTGVGQANALVPLLVAAPAYFAGYMTLGSIVQVRYAYGQVSGSLSWFVNAYQEIARWRANVERLATFAEVMDTTYAEVAQGGVQLTPDGDRLRLADVRLMGRDGRVLFEGANLELTAGENLALTGPSGLGKTVLVRALAGLWPFGQGRIQLPRARILFLPQEPYFPIGTLRDVVSFPSAGGSFSDDRVHEVLELLGLSELVGRLDDIEQWERRLSPHEQQRLALARVFLHEPEWLLLDKATSALDEETELAVYTMLQRRLPHTTTISVAHRATIAHFHARRWVLAPDEDGRITLRTA